MPRNGGVARRRGLSLKRLALIRRYCAPYRSDWVRWGKDWRRWHRHVVSSKSAWR